METNNLQTFLSIVQNGSFTKTAEENFISSTAVMKQINRLEQELDIKLFNRSNSGVTLTKAGEKFINYAEEILKLSQRAYIECHSLEQERQIIRLGTSLLHPSQPFMPIWNKIRSKVIGYDLQIVQVSSDLTAHNREYAMLGQECDIMIGTFDQMTTRTLVQAIPLGSYKFEIAVRNDNPLALKSEIEYSDLIGQTVLMVPDGVSEKNDELKKQLIKKVPNIQIKYTSGRYDIDVFNKTVNENLALVNLTPWRNIHPNLVSVPLKTKIDVEYGVLAPKNANSQLDNFMAILRRVI